MKATDHDRAPDRASDRAGDRSSTGEGEIRASIHGHARPRFFSSLRVRLLVPVLLATLAVAGLGALPISSELSQATRADRSITLADAAASVGSLIHEIAAEFVASNMARRTGSTSTLDPQLARTNGALYAYEANVASIVLADPDLGRLTAAAAGALHGLGSAREVAAQFPDGSVEVAAFYDQMMTSLLALADALPPQMPEPTLIDLARSVALAASLDRLAALQLDLISRALSRPGLNGHEQIQLAQWAGSERTNIEALMNIADGRELYGDVERSVNSTTAASIRQVFLDDQTGNAALGVEAQAWSTTQGGRFADVWTMEQQLTQRLDTTAAALGTAARERAVLLIAASALVLLAILGTTFAIVITISQQLRRTRYAALSAARIELPSAINQVTSARDPAMVRTVLANSSNRVESMLHSGQDELGELAAAFGTVHRTALRLAADQALLRMEVQELFIALSRRGQTLVQRQIHLIDQFGRDETDPDALGRLFALDHLAARMRRNEENLLVLAGGEPGRWITRPVSIVDLIRAAAQEVEDYQRVDVVEAPDQAIGATLAGDAIHLLAELIENAAAYSRPETRVRVAARRSAGGLVITVHDDGIGISPDRLAEANDRLARPSALTSTLVGTMGLLVVARLAQRHGIEVRLESVPAGGTTATVTLPDRLVLPLTDDANLYSGQWLRESPDVYLSESTVELSPIPLPSAATLPRQVQAAPPAPTVVPVAAAPPPPASPSPSVPTPSVPTPSGPSPSVPSQAPPFTGPPARPVDAGRTATGLPRRPAEEPRSTVEAVTAPPSTPDPEAVRARLSSLASGIAAATQDQPTPSHPLSEARTTT